MSSALNLLSLDPNLPRQAGHQQHFSQLHGSSHGLLLAACAQHRGGAALAVTPDAATGNRLEDEIRFYCGEQKALPVLHFPDWETLPYDTFSPHQDIISDRLAILYQLPRLEQGVLIISVATLMQRLPPRDYLESHGLVLATGERLHLDNWRKRLERSGYHCVSQVMEHGEFAVRGAIIDLFPMGSDTPYRIELFDEEVDSLRTFDPETQRSLQTVERIHLLPAREFPLTEEAIVQFRTNYRSAFPGDPQRSPVYRQVSEGNSPPGIESYLPFFFDRTDTLFDYLPADTLAVTMEAVKTTADAFWKEVGERYEQRRHDLERPLLSPSQLYLQPHEVFGALKAFPRASLQRAKQEEEKANQRNFGTEPPPQLIINARSNRPMAALGQFLAAYEGRVLFAAETTGRRETLLELLNNHGWRPRQFENWAAFLQAQDRLGITVAPLQQGLLLQSPPIAVIAEAQLFGEQAMQQRRRKERARDPEAVVRNLTELSLGAPVVHEAHGVGRYLGLQTLEVGKVRAEYMALEYADGDKLYVPVSSLYLISRYTGVSPEAAPLHKLGSGHWERAKRKAQERVRDVAAELLAIYAQRAARKRAALPIPHSLYAAFARAFPFEETPDQAEAIQAVIADLASEQPMDRLICGDVGFGKTEVAMRAAFIVSQAGKQVAVLVPTTLLAQQHYQSFKDRFADWPIRIEMMSRFRSRKQQETAMGEITAGTADIIIGTHKLLQDNIRFKDLGLVIIDEEHRFGVRQKERMKALRAEVDVLTLTATPIPRTLHLSLSGLRDLSIIATPPARRLAVKTFVREWDETLLREALQREIRRGGQVYFLHNEVESIDQMAQRVQTLYPDAKIRVAHGQMREQQLEQVMLDFYHQRFNVLVCSTIIETGIDIPSANTIIIHRADKFGLAQLYQLRGRVGRSHHRAYAYLITPHRSAITADAAKRLDAIESLEELGAGFTLATHDMEIRGAGELLGKDQSGQMQEIGFSLYNELLERAVKTLKSGQSLNLEQLPEHGPEVDLHAPALIPEDYLPDIHTRLVLYKRIAGTQNLDELKELQVEMIDRFGLLPEATKTLFASHELRLKAGGIGIRKIEAHTQGGRIHFLAEPGIDPKAMIHLIQEQPNIYQLDGQEKLRFTQELPDAQARLDALEKLLNRLTMKEAA